MLIETLINSAPNLAIFFYMLFLIRNTSRASRRVLLLGASLILLTTLAAVPYSYWVFSKYAVLNEFSYGVAISTLPINILQALGLLLFIKAYVGAVNNT